MSPLTKRVVRWSGICTVLGGIAYIVLSSLSFATPGVWLGFYLNILLLVANLLTLSGLTGLHILQQETKSDRYGFRGDASYSLIFIAYYALFMQSLGVCLAEVVGAQVPDWFHSSVFSWIVVSAFILFGLATLRAWELQYQYNYVLIVLLSLAMFAVQHLEGAPSGFWYSSEAVGLALHSGAVLAGLMWVLLGCVLAQWGTPWRQDKRDVNEKVNRENSLLFTGFLAIAVTAFTQLLQKDDLSTALNISVFCFSVSIPLLAGFVFMAVLETRFKKTYEPAYVFIAQVFGALANAIGIVALFWHFFALAGILVTVAGILTSVLAYEFLKSLREAN